tara:strand:- start:419 stop:1093 length:675 start_codon:yes stop_codon:yes gene_type:complete
MSDETNMTGGPAHDEFINALSADLAPVRRLWSPAVRSALWFTAVGAAALAIASVSDLPAMALHIASVPDMWLAIIGSVLTGILGAIAVFHLSMPDRSPHWALLPLPAAALWLGASGMGCLRYILQPESHFAGIAEAPDCLMFILGLSLPMSVVMIFAMRRAFTLYPARTSAVAGLAIAATAASMLNLFHPFDATSTDVAVHAFAIAIVIGTNRFLGGRLLNTEK